MGSIIMQVFLYTFFVYGVVTFVDQIIDRLHSDPCAVYVDTILLVKDQEDTIELEINNVLKRIDGRLIVVDRGSTDDTMPILRKMEQVNENMTVLTVGDSVRLGA